MKQITRPRRTTLLRAFIEEFVKNCRFIFTCNYKNKIIEPLHSRCAVVGSELKEKDRPILAPFQFFNRIKKSWIREGIEYDNKVMVELVNKYFPDWRQALNELQRYSVGGRLILVSGGVL